MLIRNPLQLRYPLVDLDDSNTKASIDAFIKLLISSNKYDSIADEEFGFSLEDFRYEGFSSEDARFLDRLPVQKDTTENTMLSAIKNPLYGKKLIGNSKNADTFARELKMCIERYERRLKDVSVTMDFQKNARIIHVIVTGVINNAANTIYYNEFNIEVW
jgi:hypothetical protein